VSSMFLKGYKKFANNAGDALPGLVCLLLLSAAFFLLEFLEIAKICWFVGIGSCHIFLEQQLSRSVAPQPLGLSFRSMKLNNIVVDVTGVTG